MEKDTSEEEHASFILLGSPSGSIGLLRQRSTWTVLKDAFLMLGVRLAAMMGLAFSGGDPLLTLHVLFLVVIAVALFVLLSCMVILYESPLVFSWISSR